MPKSKTQIVEAKQLDLFAPVEVHAERIDKAKVGMVKNIFIIGAELAKAHDKLANRGNGVFEGWVENRCGFSIRTARNYMDASYAFGAKDSAKFAETFDPSAMYVLAAPSAPKQAIRTSLRRAEAGEKITHAVAQEIVTEAKAELAESKAKAERKTERAERKADAGRAERAERKADEKPMPAQESGKAATRSKPVAESASAETGDTKPIVEKISYGASDVTTRMAAGTIFEEPHRWNVRLQEDLEAVPAEMNFQLLSFHVAHLNTMKDALVKAGLAPVIDAECFELNDTADLVIEMILLERRTRVPVEKHSAFMDRLILVLDGFAKKRKKPGAGKKKTGSRGRGISSESGG